VNKGYECILKVKGNQKTLYQALVIQSQMAFLLDQHGSNEKNRGRIEKRLLEIYEFPTELKIKWPKMLTMIKLTRYGQRAGKQYLHENFYISTLARPAEEFQNLIRDYWKVENQLHYVKLLSPDLSGDVDFLEDRHRMKKYNIAANLSIFRGCAISLIRAKKGKSIKKVQEELFNRPDKMLKLLE